MTALPLPKQASPAIDGPTGGAGNRAGRLGPGHRAAWWCVAAASLWLRSGFPVTAFGDAGLDDALFLHMARNMGAGLWLGPFDNTTLVKGMVYPLFILLSFAAGIPLKLAEQAVYLAVSAFVAAWTARACGRRWVGTVLFVALAFNPVLWNVGLSRVIREGLYISLSFGVVGLVASLAIPRACASPVRLLRGLVLGLVGGAFWLTREEGVWLLPAVAVVILIGLADALRPRPDLPHRGAGMRRASHWLARCGVPLLVACLGCAGVVGAVMSINAHVYGMAETVEVKSPAFEHAYGAISRIAQRDWRRYVVFPRDARELAYRVSPAASELRPSLDGRAGETWRAVGCEASPMPDCTEIQASWFQWALRDAVRAAGHYSSLPEAARFYERLAQEINDACDRQTIPCLPPRTGLLPPFRWHYIGDAMRSAGQLGGLLLQLSGNDIRRMPSAGLGLSIDLFAETVGPVARSMVTWSIIEGWVGAAGETPQLSLHVPAGSSIRSELLVTAGNAPPSRPGLSMHRVRLITDCPAEACDLVVMHGDQSITVGRVTDLAVRPVIDRPDLFFEVSWLSSHVAAQGQERRDMLIERIARGIGRLYAWLTPVLVVLGTIGLVATLVARRWDALDTPLAMLAAASAVAVLCRIVLLAYMDATSILSRDMLYVSPASPFVVLFAIAGTTLLAELAIGVVRRRTG